MKEISRSELDDCWSAARRRILRLEQFREYRVPADLEVFELHRTGKRIPSSRLHPDWYGRIADIVRSGVRVDRVRVLDVPIPPYQRYEIDWGYAVGRRYGQAAWAIRRELYEDLRSKNGLVAQDFWIFDDDPILVGYDSGIDRTTQWRLDGNEAKQLRLFATALMGRVFSLWDFCKAHGIVASLDRIDWDHRPPDVPPIM